MILLIMNNFTAHPPEIKNLESVKILFLSLNITCDLQLMDPDVIQCFKNVSKATGQRHSKQLISK